MWFTEHEDRRLRPEGGRYQSRGGYQDLVNWYLDNIEQPNAAGLRRCWVDPIHLDRTLRGVQNYGDGGPQDRLRDACIPAFARAGVIMVRPPRGMRPPKRRHHA